MSTRTRLRIKRPVFLSPSTSEEKKEESLPLPLPLSRWKHVEGVLGEKQDDRIQLLRDPTVLQWLYGDTSFLVVPDGTKKTKGGQTEARKKQEDAWGQQVMRLRRPDLKLDKQWTNRFGEYICEELLLLRGQIPTKPPKRNTYQPDVESKDVIWEVKTQTFHTEGTAGEKILGCPFKYAEVPELYGKPLHILCMGGAEKLSREKYGNLPGPKQTPQKKRLLEAARSLGIHYVGATDVLEEWLQEREQEQKKAAMFSTSE